MNIKQDISGSVRWEHGASLYTCATTVGYRARRNVARGRAPNLLNENLKAFTNLQTTPRTVTEGAAASRVGIPGSGWHRTACRPRCSGLTAGAQRPPMPTSGKSEYHGLCHVTLQTQTDTSPHPQSQISGCLAFSRLGIHESRLWGRLALPGDTMLQSRES